MINTSKTLVLLEKFYDELTILTSNLELIHKHRLKCTTGCSSCCIDDVTVFEIEAVYIKQHNETLLKSKSPYSKGACAFLDKNGACRIYPTRPYVCRTQGLPLRWIDELKNGTLVEMRDICPENENGTPVESLREEECWRLGLFEKKLATFQFQTYKGKMKRVTLRSLFIP